MTITKIVVMKLVLLEDKADNCGYSNRFFFALHSKVLECTSEQLEIPCYLTPSKQLGKHHLNIHT